MEMICKVIKAVSSKTNKEYICLEVTFPNGYVKRVFLTQPELYMVKEYAETR